MLRAQILNASDARASGQIVKRCIPFPQRDGVLFGDVRQQLAESPDAALVKEIAGRAAAHPERLERLRIGCESGEDEFQQITAIGAAKVRG